MYSILGLKLQIPIYLIYNLESKSIILISSFLSNEKGTGKVPALKYSDDKILQSINKYVSFYCFSKIFIFYK